MKTLLLLFTLTFTTSFSFSQIMKGQYMIGGNAGFSSTSSNGRTFTIIQLNPNFGYFFVDKFAGGLRVQLASSKETGSSSATASLIAPFIRYYFLPTTQKVNLFADLAYGFGSSSNGVGNSISSNEYAISAGPAVFLTPNTALEFALQYSSLGGEGGGERLGTIGMNIGFQIHLGRPRK